MLHRYVIYIYIYIDDFLIRTCAVGKCFQQGLGGYELPPLENSNSLNSHCKFHKNRPRPPLPTLQENKIIFRPPPPHWKFLFLDPRMCNNNFIVLLNSLNSYIDVNYVACRVYCTLFYFQRADHSNCTKGQLDDCIKCIQLYHVNIKTFHSIG